MIFPINIFVKRHSGVNSKREEKSEKPHSCSVCGKSFIQRSYLQTHMNSHSGQKPYSCTACGKRFIRRSHLIIHMNTHTGKNI
uniref:Zinc finger protein 2 homolog n=1 Tax=Maylandia zebra TaxID=106582 RepID=A0A3P9BZA0_9CICH